MQNSRMSFPTLNVLKAFFFLAILLGLGGHIAAQQKYWIEFTDKGTHCRYEPHEVLSFQALQRRQAQGIAVDETDYPVCPDYILRLKKQRIKPVQISRWINAVSAALSAEQIVYLSQQPFVKSIRAVKTSLVSKSELACDTLPFYNTYLQQLSMIGLDKLQAKGYTGKGIIIAVFDNGFTRVNTIGGFQHLFSEKRILATRDFVSNEENVYDPCIDCRHGVSVLSILAAKVPNQLQGTAPDASYILLRTENDSSETHQEEDNWVAAAEYADSLGAQVFSTSLGYFDFDPGQRDYTQGEMDGNTAIITRASDIAAAKGILVVNSAGNSGFAGLSAPADGDSVIAVGAIDPCQEIAGFSSRGFSADSRVKPDVVALGASTFLLNSSGQVSRGNGTSFSCPVISGMLACLLQANPEKSAYDIYKAMITSADRWENPDRNYGYGIPNATLADSILKKESAVPATPLLQAIGDWVVYPNPVQERLYIDIRSEKNFPTAQLRMYDIQGRLVYSQASPITQGLNKLAIEALDFNGLYYLHVYSEDSREFFGLSKAVRFQ